MGATMEGTRDEAETRARRAGAATRDLVSHASVHVTRAHVVDRLARDKLLHLLNALAAALPHLKAHHRPVLQQYAHRQ